MSSTNGPVIELVKVTHHYGVRPILRDFSFSVSAGECVAVLGPNGMGKSTMLGLIGGILSPVSGAVKIAGKVRRSTPEDEIAIRRQISFLPDAPWLPNTLTLREFLVALGEIYDVPPGPLFDQIDRLIELFEMAAVADSTLGSYSAGQTKKAGLCGALVAQLPILVFDEPFSGGLDPAGLMAVKGLLKQLPQARGTTILFASPVPELVEEVATRIVVLAQGTVVADGTLEALRQQFAAKSLEEILGKLLHPKTQENLAKYFAEPG